MKILYFIDKQTYLEKLCRARFIGFDILEKNKEITMKYWGNGWENYNSNLTVQENINKLNDTFDIAFVYKPLKLNNFKDITVIKAIQYNEMYDIKGTLQEIKESGCQLIICHHLNDCIQYQNMKIPNINFVYIGHCAEKTIFKNYNIKKEYDILIAGYIYDHYPLRQKFLKLLPILRKKYKCHRHPHPGYNLIDAYTNKYQKEMAIAINKARITLTCAGKPRTRYGKYVEIPMCGTSAICGDLPNDNEDYSFAINVSNDMTLQEIQYVICDYLDNEEKRLEKVNKGIIFAKEYTAEKYAEKIVKEINNYIN